MPNYRKKLKLNTALIVFTGIFTGCSTQNHAPADTSPKINQVDKHKIKDILANAKNYAKFIVKQTSSDIEEYLKRDPHQAELGTLRGLLLDSSRDLTEKLKAEIISALRKGDMHQARQKLDAALDLQAVSPYAVMNGTADLPQMSYTVEQILQELQKSQDQKLQETATMLKAISELEPFFNAQSHRMAQELINKIDSLN